MSRKRNASSDAGSNRSSKKAKSSLERGYIVDFQWDLHFNNAVDKPITAARPMKSPLVPSIPTLFHSVLSTLQPVVWEALDKDVFTGLDTKIIRDYSSTRDKGKDFLISQDNRKVIVNACRKEHVRLIYTDVLGTLGLCPQLIDVHYISPEKDFLVGGGTTVECTCAHNALTTGNNDEAKTAVVNQGVAAEVDAVEVDASAAAAAAAMDTSEEVTVETDEDTVRALEAAELQKEKQREQARIDAETARKRKKIIESVQRESKQILAPCWEDLNTALVSARENVHNTWKTLLDDRFNQLVTLKEELAEANARKNEFEELWKQEKDHNELLNQRIAGIKARVIRMSKQPK